MPLPWAIRAGTTMADTESTTASFAERLARLHEAHYVRIVRRWRFQCRSLSDAEDLIQEAFTRLYRRYKLGEAMPESETVLLQLLHVTARHLLIDEVRAASALKRQRLHHGGEEEEGTAHDGAEPIERATDRHQPIGLDHPVEDEVATRQLLDYLLDTLDPHWARVLALMCEDFSPPEIGAAMEGRNGYVLVRQARIHICRVLQDLAATGDHAAGWMGIRFCGWPAPPPDAPTQ